jgi:CRP-like cAMP-binding protein
MRPPGELFATATDRQIEQAMPHFQSVQVACADVLMEQKDRDPALLFLVDGRLEIVRDGVVIDTSGPGEVVGEMSLFTGRPRTATVRASEDCELLVLERSGYESLRDAGNEVAFSLERLALRLLDQRLRRLDGLVSERAAGEPSPYAKPAASIFDRIRGMFGSKKKVASLTANKLDPVDVMEKSPLFRGERHIYLKVIASLLRQETFGPGEFLTRQGEPGDATYFIGSGNVDVVVYTQTEAWEGEHIHRLAKLGPGAACGLTALGDRPRMTSCIAEDQVEVLALDRQTWATIVAEQTRASSVARVAMIRAYADQLAAAQKALVKSASGEERRLRAGAQLEMTGSTELENE